jgi:hypothetical protein
VDVCLVFLYKQNEFDSWKFCSFRLIRCMNNVVNVCNQRIRFLHFVCFMVNKLTAHIPGKYVASASLFCHTVRSTGALDFA